ncbi:MAG: SprB repeat-containing protein [Bacteroidota bacterium]
MSAVLFFQGPNMPFTVTVTGPSFTLGPVLVASVLQLSNLCPGTYQVSIVDNQGFNCSVTPVNIIGLPAVVLSYQVTNASCPTCNDGAVVLSASGGAPPYTYNFSTGSTTTFQNNLLPGSYYAYVTDANGCTDVDTIVVGVGGNSNFTVSGELYLDINSNGLKDAGEPGMGNQQAVITPPGSNLISSPLGGYGSIVAAGNYAISYDTLPGWSLTSSPATYNVSVTTASIGGLDFGITPDSIAASGLLSLTSGLPRCNWTVPYYINFHNNGFTPLTGSISFNHDPLLTYLSSTVPFSSQVGNVVNFNFTNLYAGQTFSTVVYMQEPGPGFTLANYLNVNCGDPFSNQIAFTDTLIQLVSCSYDPNDKAVYPAGIGPLNYVSMDQRLEYLIRFQNTGNDTAFKVVIVDTLAVGLDKSSFTILGSSHPMNTEITSNGTATFTFNNILLPDSNVNEPGSHGYVLFSISGNFTNPDPTTVNNTAYIYFDLNAPVQTNTTLTTFSDNYLGIDDLVSNSVISIAPNPFNGEASITCESCQGEYLLLLTDLVGKVVQTQSVSGSNWTISKGSLTQGTYVLEARSARTGQSNRLKVTVY